MTETTADRTYSLVETHPRALVIHCGDPRFQKAFAEFIRNELSLQEGEFVPFVVSGGVASLSEPLKLPKEFKFMKERIEFILENFTTINRIVLINHEDCRHYEMMRSVLGRLFLQHVSHMDERHVGDLRAVAKLLLGYASAHHQVELYYARITPEKSVRFEQVPLSAG